MSEVDLSDFIKASNKFHEKKASWEGLNKEFIDELKEDTDRLLGFYFYGGMFMATHKIQQLQSDYSQLKQSAENSISQVNGEKAGLRLEYDDLKLSYGFIAAQRDIAIKEKAGLEIEMDKLREAYLDVVKHVAGADQEIIDFYMRVAGLTDKEVGG